MRKAFLLAALLLRTVPAAALEVVQISGPGAGEQAAPEPAAPRPPFAGEADLRETLKYLSMALEYGDKLQADRLEDLGKDAARLTGTLKKAIGPELLKEAAAREKLAEDARRSAAAQKALADFRWALQVNYGENGGKYPENPASLAGGKLKLVPFLLLPDHEQTSDIKISDSKKSYADLGKAVNDDGGWLYFSNPESEHYGLLLINCRHKSPAGTEFYKY